MLGWLREIRGGNLSPVSFLDAESRVSPIPPGRKQAEFAVRIRVKTPNIFGNRWHVIGDVVECREDRAIQDIVAGDAELADGSSLSDVGRAYLRALRSYSSASDAPPPVYDPAY